MGLEVLYLEKFFESNPNASPHQFQVFSSPAVEDLVPGRYVFWARDPATSMHGMRKEGRIALGDSAEQIEVLAP